MHPEFDSRDEEIRQQRIVEWYAIEGPREGDFVEMLDGTTRRITNDCGDSIQTTSAKYPEDASFYFNGACSFSGSLDFPFPKANLEDTCEIRDGAVWFFHHNEVKAHNRVNCLIPCRVYRQLVDSLTADGDIDSKCITANIAAEKD